MTATQRTFLLILIAIGVVASLTVLVRRVAVERSNRTVGVAVDFVEVEQLAGATGGSLEAVMLQLKDAGATHLAVTEESLQDLIDRGQASAFSRDGTARLRLDSAYRLQQVTIALSSRFPGSYTHLGEAEGDFRLSCPSAATSLPATGVGYSREALEAARSVGLKVVARPRWEGIRSEIAVDASLQLAADAGAELVVFQGDQIVGFPGLVGATADALRERGMTFGFVELAPQNGAAALAAKLDAKIVRVHSITEAEMRTISFSRATGRFVKAVREREVRLCYLRLFPGDDRGPARINTDYVGAVCAGLRANGMQLGSPGPFDELSTPAWVLILVRLATVGAALWIVQAIFGLPGVWFWLIKTGLDP